MNSMEIRMLDILKELRDNYNVIAIKAEFEAEGSRTDELVRLNQVIFRADMELTIKIGGCEAVRDLDYCRILGASGIMAPMIETPFAMKKFIEAINKVYSKEEQRSIKFIINTETITCFNNLDAIFSVHGVKETINAIAVGRVDFTSSLGYGRDKLNSDEIYDYTRKMLEKAREYGIIPGMGGGISLEAVPFVHKLGDVVQKFETRKVVFKYTKDMNIEKGLLLAMEFEILYLKNKELLYQSMADEDRTRVKMMEERFESMKKIIK